MASTTRSVVLSTAAVFFMGLVGSAVSFVLPPVGRRAVLAPRVGSAHASGNGQGGGEGSGGVGGGGGRAVPKKRRPQYDTRAGKPTSPPTIADTQNRQKLPPQQPPPLQQPQRRTHDAAGAPPAAAAAEDTANGPIEALRPLRGDGGAVWAEVNPAETAALYDRALQFCFSRSEDRWQQGLQIIREMEVKRHSSHMKKVFFKNRCF